MSRLRFYILILACAVSTTSLAPSSMQAIRVAINIPAARLDVYIDDDRVASYPIAVGTSKYPTPVGQFLINEITWNPWWIPPESDWALGEKPLPPGPGNPMGQVKLQFAPLYFIHGTPDSASIGHPGSHGCVRMYNADALALARMLTALQPLSEVVQTTHQTRVQILPHPVPVTISYDRVEANDSTVTLHPDPYWRGTPNLIDAKAILERSGPGTVDEERLVAFLKLSGSRRFIVSRSSLVVNY